MEGPIENSSEVIRDLRTIIRNASRKTLNDARTAVQTPPPTPQAIECRATEGKRPSDVARAAQPGGYSWVAHEQAGSRAAQRRLRQKGITPTSRCAQCGEWRAIDRFVKQADGAIACDACTSGS